MDEFVRELKESAAGLHDGMGGHADYCALLMERAASFIADYKETFTAHALALKAAKAMQQAETERADKAEAECRHWKANHENQVLRARILMERPDMPIERVKAYKRMQELETLSDELFNTLNFERGSRVDLERDAARYRWLRTASTDKIQDPERCEAVGNLPAEPTDVDEAIDQAMGNL